MLFYKTQTKWLFHSNIKIKIPVFYDDVLMEEFFHILENIDKQYNSYSTGSFFNKINKNTGKYAEVDSETIKILTKTNEVSELLDGLYDITIMPLIRLWGFYKDNSTRIPSQEEIENMLKKVDFRKIKINANQVMIDTDQEIITGSFMKAYAVDQVIKSMKAKGIQDAIINAGGSTITTLNNENHPYWTINISEPEDKTKSLFKVKLANSCFSTSAQNSSYIEIEGKKYGHILNPKTGFPSPNKQVGIISKNCFWGDVISTAVFNLNTDDFIKKMKVISEKIPVSGFLINEYDDIIFANNFEKNILH